MIASLTGILKSKSPTEIHLDVHGVGYAVSIPLSTFEKLAETGTTTTILTYLHVREDALQLYGFATGQELALFKLLISVSGIGPRIAQGILSGMPVHDLRSAIQNGNVHALTAAPGIGKKTAERLIMELREKITRDDPSVPSRTGGIEDERNQALLALTSLGYSRPAAEKALRLALAEANGARMSLEDLIKNALKHTGT
jgi:Holliday junction DNA helicase RuvA